MVKGEKAANLLKTMRENNVRIDKAVFQSSLDACAKIGKVGLALDILTWMKEAGK